MQIKSKYQNYTKPYATFLAWDNHGREIHPRNGLTIPAGSIIQKDGQFITLAKPAIIRLDTTYNDMGQINGKYFYIDLT